MRPQILFVVLFFAGCAFAFCAQPEVNEQHLREYPEAIAEMEEQEERIANITRVMMHEREVTNFRIPVVFHIFNPPSPVAGYPSVTDETVHQEMTWLNQWYSAANTYYLRSDPLWSNSKATADDFGITFELAAFDPQGRPTTGINRYTTTIATNGFCQLRFSKPANGGIDLWDVTRYYNVILCDLPDPKLGFAYIPVASKPYASDGAVLDTAHFGDPLASGTVLAHETGHYLNLYHTFESCSPGDRVDDTPAHIKDSITLGFPHCPPDQAETAFTSDCPNVGNFMTQNIMNYNTFPCTSFFSKGQVTRIRALLLTHPVRKTLPTSPGLATGGACIPSCSGRQCGEDGCGGTCGTCTGACKLAGVNYQCITDNLFCETGTLVAINYNVPVTLSTTIVSNPPPDFGPYLFCSDTSVRNPRWYRFVAPHSNGVRIQTTGELATTLSVFTGSCTNNNLYCITVSSTKMVNFCAITGTIYHIAVGSSFFGATSVVFEYVPNVQCCTPTCGGKLCGSDGCGGFCGQCQSYQTCNSDFECVGNSPSPSPVLNGPIIICPHDLVKTVSECSYSGPVGTPQVIVPDGVTYHLTINPKAPYFVGNTAITHVASANGYTATCTQRLTVQSSKDCENDEK